VPPAPMGANPALATLACEAWMHVRQRGSAGVCNGQRQDPVGFPGERNPGGAENPSGFLGFGHDNVRYRA